MGQKLSNVHCLVDKAMTMCESNLTKTYLKISGASSCRCIGIAGCLRCNRGSFTWFLGKSLVICQCRMGRGHKMRWRVGYNLLANFDRKRLVDRLVGR